MTAAEREAVVERMAAQMYGAHRDGVDDAEWPDLPEDARVLWRKYARAALAVAEPVVREACAVVAEGSPSLSHRHIAAAIRSAGKEAP